MSRPTEDDVIVIRGRGRRYASMAAASIGFVLVEGLMLMAPQPESALLPWSMASQSVVGGLAMLFGGIGLSVIVFVAGRPILLLGPDEVTDCRRRMTIPYSEIRAVSATEQDAEQTPQQSGNFDGLVSRIQREFSFLVDEYGFAAGVPRRSGDTTSVRYEHSRVIIQFSVRGGEWQVLVWPAVADHQALQVTLDDVVMYLTQPPVDFVADQARPGLSQSEALSELAQQLAPITGAMLALFEPARWPTTWAKIQAVLHVRRAERSRQFVQWRRSTLGSE